MCIVRSGKLSGIRKQKQVKGASRSSSGTSSVTLVESDYPLLFPASSLPSTSDDAREMSAESEHDENEEGGCEYDGREQGFHQLWNNNR